VTPAWRPPEIEFSVTEGGAGQPLLLLHGFTGAAASWALHFDSFAGRHRVIAPDLPGHGGTAETSALDGMTVEATADALARLLAERGVVPASVLGYSLGARIALRLAIEHPAAVGRLILESPSAGIADRAARAARRVDDATLAERLEHDGIADFVTTWEHNPVFASHAAANPQLLAQQRAIRLTSRPAGLAASLRAAGQGSMQPLHARLGEVTAPTLVISGALDAVGRPRAEEVANGIAGSRLEILEAVGHTPHLESPDAFRRLVLDFLQEDPAA
jgi:2-succinyl-6-hydroxy-2,4-cyclohexadiene-1-carboxylate synthase